MPRPKSGNDPWKIIALKLPEAMLVELKRYADLHGMNYSAVLREGLVQLLQETTTPREYNGYTPTGTPPETRAVAARLRRLADELDPVPADVTDVVTKPDFDVATSPVLEDTDHVIDPDVVTEDGLAHVTGPVLEDVNGPRTDFVTPCITIPTVPTFLFNPARHRLGALCKRQHDHTGLGESVREIGGDKPCVECRHERSARHATKANQTRAKRLAAQRG